MSDAKPFNHAEHYLEQAEKQMVFDKPKLVARAILCDCLGRKGIKNEFSQIDSEVLESIVDDWTAIIRKGLKL